MDETVKLDRDEHEWTQNILLHTLTEIKGFTSVILFEIFSSQAECTGTQKITNVPWGKGAGLEEAWGGLKGLMVNIAELKIPIQL